MEGGRTFQEHSGIGFRVGARSRSLAARWNGGQPGYAQQFYRLAIPLLLDLMPMFSLIVRTEKSSIAIQRQLGTSYYQMEHRK
jgi:hypothetical protein